MNRPLKVEMVEDIAIDVDGLYEGFLTDNELDADRWKDNCSRIGAFEQFIEIVSKRYGCNRSTDSHVPPSVKSRILRIARILTDSIKGRATRLWRFYGSENGKTLVLDILEDYKNCLHYNPGISKKFRNTIFRLNKK